MGTFLKNVLLNLAAFFVSTVVLIAVVIGLYVAIIGSLANQPIQVPEGAVLNLDLRMNINDSPREFDLGRTLEQALEGKQAQVYYLHEVVEAIDRAARDERISGLFIYGNLAGSDFGNSLATLREVREALVRFREASGKPVKAFLNGASTGDYYLASASGDLAMSPEGMLDLNGLAAQGIYLKDFLDRYGIGVQVAAIGKYKSAAESLTRSSRSEADREQTEALLDTLWVTLLEDIGASRGLEPKAIREMAADTELFMEADDAVRGGLIDRTAYLDEILNELGDLAGVNPETGTYEQIAFPEYVGATVHHSGLGDPAADVLPGVAIVYAEGTIVGGEGDYNQAGAERVSRNLRQARKDEDIKAIVFRVNSPGGSSVASDIIGREVQLAAAAKPLIVSQGGYAASGGYWISAHGDRIFTDPVTVTGSIGVVALLPNVQGLANGQGIYFDSVKSEPFADSLSIFKPLDEREYGALERLAANSYDSFIQTVAAGRSMDAQAVRGIAQGRVWSGQDAIGRGLADESGGLMPSIRAAAESAGLTEGEYAIRHYPQPDPVARQIQRILSTEVVPTLDRVGLRSPVERQLFDSVEEVRAFLSVFDDPRHTYALMPTRFRFSN